METDTIFKYGESGDRFYIILDGNVLVLQPTSAKIKKMRDEEKRRNLYLLRQGAKEYKEAGD